MKVKLKLNRERTIIAANAKRIVLLMRGSKIDPGPWQGPLHGQPRMFMRRVRDYLEKLTGSQVRIRVGSYRVFLEDLAAVGLLEIENSMPGNPSPTIETGSRKTETSQPR
jgi:hypothetical protein